MLAFHVPSPHFTFSFVYPTPLLTPLTFRRQSICSGSHHDSLKRSRPLADLDEYPPSTPNVHGRKKRRLRLSLITSRLSRPFSKPATYIVDRGNCKVAVWARQRCLARVWLRKRAIMNSVRWTGCQFRGVQHLPSPACEKTPCNDRQPPSTLNSPNASHARRGSFEEDRAPHLVPKPPTRDSNPNSAPPEYGVQAPSPLGLSNYDALDDDDAYSTYSEQASEEAEDEWSYTPHPDLVDAESAAAQPSSTAGHDRHDPCQPLRWDMKPPPREALENGPPSPCPSSSSSSSLPESTLHGSYFAQVTTSPTAAPQHQTRAASPLLPPSPSLSPCPETSDDQPCTSLALASPNNATQQTSPYCKSPSSSPQIGTVQRNPNFSPSPAWDLPSDLDLGDLDISMRERPPSAEELDLEPPEEEMFDLVKRRFGGQRFLGLWVSG